MSEFEDFPWFQWQIYRKPKKIEEVVIVIPRRVYNKLEKRMLDEQFEVRAGLDKIGNSFRGQITKNEVCDSYRPNNPTLVKGDYARYVFACNNQQEFIKAAYVTVQILGFSALAISEIEAKWYEKKKGVPKRKFIEKGW